MNIIPEGRQKVRDDLQDFMAKLVEEEETWRKWSNKFPHIINVD